MIAAVSGAVVARALDHVVVEAAGVGYRLSVSSGTLDRLPRVGAPASLLAHLIVRDDTMNLYGFAEADERELFLLLIGVSGVGPKVALAVLSSGPVHELQRGIATGDVKRFTSVPGIGRRTAERIILELRERVTPPPAPAGAPAPDDPQAIAREALAGLGFAPAEAEEMLKSAAGSTAEELIATALKRAA